MTIALAIVLITVSFVALYLPIRIGIHFVSKFNCPVTLMETMTFGLTLFSTTIVALGVVLAVESVQVLLSPDFKGLVVIFVGLLAYAYAIPLLITTLRVYSTWRKQAYEEESSWGQEVYRMGVQQGTLEANAKLWDSLTRTVSRETLN